MNSWRASRIKVLEPRAGGVRERTSGVGHHSMPRPHRPSAFLSPFLNLACQSVDSKPATRRHKMPRGMKKGNSRGY